MYYNMVRFKRAHLDVYMRALLTAMRRSFHFLSHLWAHQDVWIEKIL